MTDLYTKVVFNNRNYYFLSRYKNKPTFEDLRKSYCRKEAQKENPEFFPCIYCFGNGQVRDPDFSPCPVEGYKMCDWVKCQVCGGTGEGNKTDFKNFIKKEQSAQKIRLEQNKQQCKQFIEIISSFNEEQKEFLKTLISMERRFSISMGDQQVEKTVIL